MHVTMIGAAVMLAASGSVAQQAPGGALAAVGLKVVQPMSDGEIAAARAKVDAILVKANAATLFDNVTDASGGKVRHRASGLVCPLGKKGQRLVFVSSDAAECETINDGTIYRTTVVKAPDGATLDSVEAATQAAVAKEPAYARASGAHVVARPRPGSGLPEHRTLRFVSRIDGHARASLLQVELVHGWILTERRESPDSKEPPLGMMELLQESTFGMSMK